MMKIFKNLNILFVILTISVSAQKVTDYKVKKGETLKDIADKFGISYTGLIRSNAGVSKRPKANTMIKIPENRFKKVKRPRDFRINKQNNFVVNKFIDSVKTHIVQPKETLYSLAKLYHISMNTLIKKNAFLSQEGLKIGQELKIPTKIVSESSGSLKLVKTHIVQPKETLYSISKLHGVDIIKLKDHNAAVLSNGVTIGDVLIIPKKEKKQVLKENEHIVVKGETVYAISRAYGISIPELLSVNDSIIIDDLSVGSVVKLPQKVLKRTSKSTVAPIYKQKPIKYIFRKGEDVDILLKQWSMSKDSLRSINPSLDSIITNGGELLIGFETKHLLFEDNKKFKDSIVIDKLVNVMIMLPFDFKKNDTLSGATLFSSPKGLPSMVADFYLGAEMALDSLKEQGVKVNFTVIDTEKSVDCIRNKIDKIKAYHPDLIIGPFYTGNTNYVASILPNTPIYYPIYAKNQKSFTANNIIKTATDRSLYQKEVISYIQENRKGEHLLIVGLNENVKRLKDLKSQLIKRDSTGGVIDNDVSILSLAKEYVSREDFLAKLKLEKNNWILITENSNVITSDVFNNVKSIRQVKDSILETPMKVLSFEKSKYAEDNISYENLAKYSYTYGTDQVEYDEVLNQVFEQAYLAKNGAYPSDFAYRGFTVTYDAVLRTLKQNSKDVFKASQRHRQAFFYDRNKGTKNENQAVFVNSIENKNGVLKVIRLR